MEERDKKTELLVGLFLFVGMILLALLILQFSSVRELFKGSYTLSVALPDGTGIREGTPVMLGGSKVGKASAKPNLNETFTGVIIPLTIYQSVKIPADAKFSIGNSGLLGDAFIEIKPTGKDAAKFLEPGTLVKGAASGGMGDLKETAAKIGEKVDVAVEDIRSAVKELHESIKKINEGALSESSMKDLKESFKHLNNVITRLDEKTLGDETSADIKSAVASLRSASKAFEESVKKLDPALAKFDSAAAKADKVMDSADSAMKTIDKSAASIGATSEEIRHGSGLLPALMQDPQLKDEFKTLITNLRRHGVLFYRDNSRRSQETSDRQDTGPRLPRPLTGTKN